MTDEAYPYEIRNCSLKRSAVQPDATHYTYRTQHGPRAFGLVAGDTHG
jgi:hypothetical protein